MSKTDAIWDRLVGGVMIYVDNFLISKYEGGKRQIDPSYDVNYDISDEILDYIEKSFDDNFEKVWFVDLGAHKNINDLQSPLQDLVLQFLPRFIQQYPEYKDAPCLHLNN